VGLSLEVEVGVFDNSVVDESLDVGVAHLVQLGAKQRFHLREGHRHTRSVSADSDRRPRFSTRFGHERVGRGGGPFGYATPSSVVTLRCTKKLLARPRSSPVPDDAAPTTRLGDWYANLLFRPGSQVVLFVNERSLLPVVVPASPASTLVARFQEATVEVLLAHHVPAAIVEAERCEMEEVGIGKTASRQVLGSMNDFAYLMDAFRDDQASLSDIAVRLASTPCSPIGMRRPADVVREMLAGGALG
jgi:hypothetical protein